MRRLALTLLLPLLTLPAFAQEARIVHPLLSAGFDWWFVVPDYPQEDSVFCSVKVVSPTEDLVHFQIGSGLSKTIHVVPHKVVTFNVDTNVFLHSSGIAKNIGLHVWPSTAEPSISVQVQQKHSNHIIVLRPAWLTDTVMMTKPAGLPRTTSNDRPSRFAIVSNTDSTIVSIRPSEDLREESASGEHCDSVAHPSGVQFSFKLDRGDVIQFKTLCTGDSTAANLSGTLLHATNAVGVMYEIDSIPSLAERDEESLTPSKLQIYPNPASGTLHISADGRLEIISTLGMNVMHRDITDSQPIDISSLPSGVYWYSLTSGAVTQSGKLLIVR
jgi:hypothetical protein